MNDAAWCRAMGRTLLRVADEPHRKRNPEVHASLRAIGFQLAAIALVMEDDDATARFVAEQPTEPNPIRESTSPGVVVAALPRKATP